MPIARLYKFIRSVLFVRGPVDVVMNASRVCAHGQHRAKNNMEDTYTKEMVSGCCSGKFYQPLGQGEWATCISCGEGCDVVECE